MKVKGKHNLTHARRHMADLARVRTFESIERYHELHIANSSQCSANIGDVMAAALAAVGSPALINLGGSVPCETDYLVASGAEFPSDITVEDMMDFNAKTLFHEMTEEDEVRRYEKIAMFFHKKEVEMIEA